MKLAYQGRLHLHVELKYSRGADRVRGRWEMKGQERGGERWGRGREEGEEGEGEGRKIGQKREGWKRKILRSPLWEGRRETMGREGEVRGREGERPTPCPPSHSRVAVSFNCTYSQYNKLLFLHSIISIVSKSRYAHYCVGSYQSYSRTCARTTRLGAKKIYVAIFLTASVLRHIEWNPKGREIYMSY